MKYQEINKNVIEKWIEEGWEWGQHISHEVYEKARQGEWDVLLTPTKVVPHNWFGDLHGKKVLGLASGGGQQMPIFRALGAACTVFDYSDKQLDSERKVASREHYDIRIVKGDMTEVLPFKDEEFDIIFHPVSNCYVEEVKPIFKECYRILKHGGVLLGGFDNGVNFLVDEDEKSIVNTMPFNPIKNPELLKRYKIEENGYQFSHSLEENIGGQLEAGFTLTNIYDDTNGSGRLEDLHVYTFFATRSIKK